MRQNNPYTEFPILRNCKRIVADELTGKEFESVLEVGTQWGESLVAIKEAFPKVKLVGVDIDGETMDLAKQFTKGIELKWGSGLQLPFKDKSFDVVFTNALFCMVYPSQVDGILNEILRVAKKYVYFVELYKEGQDIGIVGNNRTAVFLEGMLLTKGIESETRKVTSEEWSVEPWLTYGYLTKAKL